MLWVGGLVVFGCAPDRTGQLNGYSELLDVMKPALVEAQYGYSGGAPCDLPGSGELGRIEVYVDLFKNGSYGVAGELFKRVRVEVYECGTRRSGTRTSSFVVEFFFAEANALRDFRFVMDARSEGWCPYRSEGLVDRLGVDALERPTLCETEVFADEPRPPIPFETLLRSAFEGCPGCLPPAW